MDPADLTSLGDAFPIMLDPNVARESDVQYIVIVEFERTRGGGLR